MNYVRILFNMFIKTLADLNPLTARIAKFAFRVIEFKPRIKYFAEKAPACASAFMELEKGLEPSTYALRERRSTV